MDAPSASEDLFAAELAAAIDAQTHAISQPLLRLLHRWHTSAEASLDSMLLCRVLNEAAFLLGVEHLRSTAWRFYRDLAERAGETDDESLKSQITIALFEVIAEPPWISRDVDLLFTLLDAPTTRWVVFAAYRRYPRTFLRHIVLYAPGQITGEEYATFLCQLGLVRTPRGLRFAARPAAQLPVTTTAPFR